MEKTKHRLFFQCTTILSHTTNKLCGHIVLSQSFVSKKWVFNVKLLSDGVGQQATSVQTLQVTQVQKLPET